MGDQIFRHLMTVKSKASSTLPDFWRYARQLEQRQDPINRKKYTERKSPAKGPSNFGTQDLVFQWVTLNPVVGRGDLCQKLIPKTLPLALIVKASFQEILSDSGLGKELVGSQLLALATSFSICRAQTAEPGCCRSARSRSSATLNCDSRTGTESSPSWMLSQRA